MEVLWVKDSHTIVNRQKDSNTMPMLEKTQIPSLPRVPPIQFWWPRCRSTPSSRHLASNLTVDLAVDRPYCRPPTTILTTTSFSFSGFRWAITLQGQAALAHKYRARFLSLWGFLKLNLCFIDASRITSRRSSNERKKSPSSGSLRSLWREAIRIGIYYEYTTIYILIRAS